MSFLVAIDGPAGSGKGTIADLVAKKLKFIHIDTGAMYRCITLYAIQNNISKDNVQKIVDSMGNIEIDQKNENDKQIFVLNGENVSERIRTEEVNKLVSDFSSIQKVREKLVLLQRKLAQNKNVIMEGRDIGTTVFPNADIKIYLDGSLEVRAKRRYKEYIEKGIEITYEEVKESIIKRDEKDRNREYGALKMAEDAILIDTTELSIDEVVGKVISIIKQKQHTLEERT